MLRFTDIPRGVPATELSDLLSPEASSDAREAVSALPERSTERADALLVLSLCLEAAGPSATAAQKPAEHLVLVLAPLREAGASHEGREEPGLPDLAADAFRLAGIAEVRLAALFACEVLSLAAAAFVRAAVPYRSAERGPLSDAVELDLALGTARAAMAAVLVRSALFGDSAAANGEDGLEDAVPPAFGIILLLLEDGDLDPGHRERAQASFEGLLDAEALLGSARKAGPGGRL
ncbi:hypothetical protein BH11ARM2_BH11ARM2_28870 [soil metagenome]